MITANLIETRSWATPYRGQLAIHAGRHFDGEKKELCLEEPFRSALKAGGYSRVADLPLGAIVAVVDLVAAGRMSTDHEGEWLIEEMEGTVTDDNELAFGWFATGRVGWVFDKETVRRLGRPIPCRGSMGLWYVPADVAAKLKDGGYLE